MPSKILNLCDPDNFQLARHTFRITTNQFQAAQNFFNQKTEKQKTDFLNLKNKKMSTKNNFHVKDCETKSRIVIYKNCTYFTTSKAIGLADLSLYAPEVFGLDRDRTDVYVPDLLLGIGYCRYILGHSEVLMGCQYFKAAIELSGIKNKNSDNKDDKHEHHSLIPIECQSFITSENHLTIFLKIITFLYLKSIKLDQKEDLRIFYEICNHLKCNQLNFLINNFKKCQVQIRSSEPTEKNPNPLPPPMLFGERLFMKNNYDRIELNNKKRVNFTIFREEFPGHIEEDPIMSFIRGEQEKNSRSTATNSNQNKKFAEGPEELKDLVEKVDKFLDGAI